MNVPFLVLNMALGIAIPLLLQLHDRRRMSPEERRWVWGFASWGSALYNFGPLSLVAWGYVTRSPRYWKGLLHGVILAEIAVVSQGVIVEVVGRAVSRSERALGDMREGTLGSMVVVAGLALLIGVCRSIYEAVRRWRRGVGPGGRGAEGPGGVPLSPVFTPPRPPRDLHHHE